MTDSTPSPGTAIALTDPSGLPMLAVRIDEAGLVDTSRFTPDRHRQATEIAAQLDLSDSRTLLTFGAEVQRQLTETLDGLLQGLTGQDVGVAGALTLELSRGIKRLNLQRMRREAQGGDWLAETLGRLPVIGRHFSALRYFYLIRQEILDELEKVVTAAEEQKRRILDNDAKLDALMEVTERNVLALEVHIAAGEHALLAARSDFTRWREELLATPPERRDALDQVKLRDFGERIAAFETRLLRMKVAYTDGIMQLPQIRLNQQAGRIEVANIMDTLLFDIPRLKGALLRIASLHDIRKANAANAARRAITREIAQAGADALQDAYLAAKTTQGDGQDDVAALAHVVDKLLLTVEQGARIDAENRAKRSAAAKQLGELKAKMVTALEAADRDAAASG